MAKRRKHKEVELSVVQRQALCSAIRERITAEEAWKRKVQLQSEVVSGILQEYGFSTDATMDLHRLDFDGVVTITEAEKEE